MSPRSPTIHPSILAVSVARSATTHSLAVRFPPLLDGLQEDLGHVHFVEVHSIDGVGAHDLISKNAMLEGLLKMEGGDQILPCNVPQWPLDVLLGRQMRVTHIAQGEVGEQGDPLHTNILRIGTAEHWKLQAGVVSMAFLDDIHITNQPGGH